MKVVRNIILIMTAIMVVMGCSERKQSHGHTIAFVSKILSDTTSYEYKIVAQKPDVNGTIAVIGSSEDAIRVSEALIASDSFNNITGKAEADQLPDFCGETVAMIMDMANEPYQTYITLGNDGVLSEINVRNYLAAMDTICLSSPYDTLNTDRKLRSKIVIFASSFASAFGYYDIDSLNHSVGSHIRIIAPVQSMVNYLYNHNDGPLNLGVWSTSDMIAAGIYSSVIPREFSKRGDDQSKYIAFSTTAPEDEIFTSDIVRSQLLDWFDKYIATGNNTRLTALIVDDPSINLEELEKFVEEIKTTDDDAMLIYKNLLSDSFECIYAGKAIAEECYMHLRKINGFTHRIAWPAMQGYVTSPVAGLDEECYDIDGSFSYAYKYSREENQPQSSFTLVVLKDKYLNETTRSFMEENAPQTYSIYVR